MANPKNAEAANGATTEAPERDSPLLDLSDPAVKKLHQDGQGPRLRHL